jgi:hypothetical protein
MGTNAVQAINVITALNTLALRALESAQRVSELNARAQAEGRDLTDAEVEEVQRLRTDAMRRWNELTGDAG